MTTATKERAKHDTSVTVRMPAQTKLLIEKAAVATCKTFSAFITESATQNAVDVLLDQRVFNLDEKQAAAFLRILDDPPAPTAKLKELMQSKSPWEM